MGRIKSNTSDVFVARGELADLICHEAGITRAVRGRLQDGVYLTRQEMIELLAFVQSLKRRLFKLKARVGEVDPRITSIGPKITSKKGRAFKWSF